MWMVVAAVLPPLSLSFAALFVWFRLWLVLRGIGTGRLAILTAADTYNTDTGEQETRVVTALFSKQADTPEHPFWEPTEQTWTPAGDLTTGDQLTITQVTTLVHNCDEVDPFELKRTEALSGNASKRNVEALTSSMKDGGWQGDPILLAEQADFLFILDGHHRGAAAKRAGIRVPFQLASDEQIVQKGYTGGIDDVMAAGRRLGQIG